jgi:hypothetical protein
MHRSRIESILNVAPVENKLPWQLGWAGEKCCASDALIAATLLHGPFEHPAASTHHSTTKPCLLATVAKCGNGEITVEVFVSRMGTGPGPHICFFHAGKPMLDQQEILDMASPKSSGISIAIHRPYSTHRNPPAST